MDIRILREDDDRPSFSCGDPDLDRFFHKYAAYNQHVIHVGVTYVAARQSEILGFVTVCAGGMTIESTSLAKVLKGFPRYPLPLLRLARLGVDTRHQRKGIGSALLAHVFGLTLQMAGSVGCVGVLVDAKPGAVAWYRRFGFMEVEARAGHLRDVPGLTLMFLPLEEIRKAAGP